MYYKSTVINEYGINTRENKCNLCLCEVSYNKQRAINKLETGWISQYNVCEIKVISKKRRPVTHMSNTDINCSWIWDCLAVLYFWISIWECITVIIPYMYTACFKQVHPSIITSFFSPSLTPSLIPFFQCLVVFIMLK
jgi:hypothetical protein